MVIVDSNFRNMVTKNYKLITDKVEEYALIRKAKEGSQKAIDALVNSQLLTIFMVIKSFHKEKDPYIKDIFNCGIVGIIKGISNFKFEHDVRFQTFCINWIKAEVSNYIRGDHVLNIPANHVAEMVKQRRLIDRGYYEEDGSITELGLKAFARGRIKTNENFVPITVSLVSIHGTIGTDDKSTLIEETIGKEDDTESDMKANRRINELLDLMDPTEKRIMELLCGLNGEVPHTEQEVGDMLGISKQRVSQIKVKISRRITKRKMVNS